MKMKRPFLTPKLEGPRFNQNSIPLEVLKDLAILEELVIEMAKWQYKERNPNRKRVPRGFTDNFILHLSSIQKGSTEACIERVYPDNLLVHNNDEFDKARDSVLDVIDSVKKNIDIEKKIAKHLLGYFDPFGKSLKEDEKIIFYLPEKTEPIVYDRSVRKKLVLATSSEYSCNTELRGCISEVDIEKGTFTLKLLNGSHIGGNFSNTLKETIFESLRDFPQTKVLVKGVVFFDQNDLPKKIEETMHLDILETNDVPTRLEEISLITHDGWLDGEGVAPKKDILQWLSSIWSSNYPQDLPLPYIYPTPEGSVQLEWSFPSHEISVEISLEKKALLVSTNTQTLKSKSHEINLTDNKEWKILIDLLKENSSSI